MGDLREQLLKSKLIDESQYRQAKRHKRLKRKKLGAKALEQESISRKKMFQEHISSEASNNRELAQKKQIAQKNAESNNRIIQMIKDSAISIGARGPVKFYFISQSGIIPCLEVSSTTASKLCSGELAIVEKPGIPTEQFVIIPGKTARQLQMESQNLVRFFNQK